MEAKDRILIALDVPTTREALDLVRELKPYVGGFKVGLELLLSMLASVVAGPNAAEAAEDIQTLFGELGTGVLFIDGKFHDIPNTVAGATRAAVAMGATMLTVHASAGTEAMQAAVAQRGGAKVLAVTVLTSLSGDEKEGDCWSIYQAPPSTQVVILAGMAQNAGCDCVVCSPLEIELVRGFSETKELIPVVPGIRTPGSPQDDQSRTMTAAEAIIAGAAYLVVGRPITKALDRIAAAQTMAAEITQALTTGIVVTATQNERSDS